MCHLYFYFVEVAVLRDPQPVFLGTRQLDPTSAIRQNDVQRLSAHIHAELLESQCAYLSSSPGQALTCSMAVVLDYWRRVHKCTVDTGFAFGHEHHNIHILPCNAVIANLVIHGNWKSVAFIKRPPDHRPRHHLLNGCWPPPRAFRYVDIHRDIFPVVPLTEARLLGLGDRMRQWMPKLETLETDDGKPFKDVIGDAVCDLEGMARSLTWETWDARRIMCI